MLQTPPNLVEYGIQNEKSDVRAHVCVVAQQVYVYRTVEGVKAIARKPYRQLPAKTGNIVTGWGYVVPPTDITGCQAVAIPVEFHDYISHYDSTSVKGNKAVEIVSHLLTHGLFPLQSVPQIVTEHDLQISGTDIVVQMQARIQVKCDYKGGRGNGATGNLYLQTAERNLYKAY